MWRVPTDKGIRMILGLGCDIVNVERLPSDLEHFQKRILGEAEQKELSARTLDDARALACLLAKYYAGKEAFAKALGTGFRDGIFLKDIQILHTTLGKPELHISGSALEHLQKITAQPHLHITLSDDFPFAQAVVIIEG